MVFSLWRYTGKRNLRVWWHLEWRGALTCPLKQLRSPTAQRTPWTCSTPTTTSAWIRTARSHTQPPPLNSPRRSSALCTNLLAGTSTATHTKVHLGLNSFWRCSFFKPLVFFLELAAEQRYPLDCPGGRSHPTTTSSLKQEPCEAFKPPSKDPDGCYPHRSPPIKDRERLNQQIGHKTGFDPELCGDRTCRGSPQDGGRRLLNGVDHSQAAQIEQRRRLCMTEIPRSHQAVRYPPLTNNPHQFGAVAKQQEEEDGQTLTHAGDTGGPRAQSTSLNFQQTLGKQRSVKANAFNICSADGPGYHGKDTTSYRCHSARTRSSLEVHRETPHYSGTSVIITNERWPPTARSLIIFIYDSFFTSVVFSLYRFQAKTKLLEPILKIQNVILSKKILL